MWLVSQKCERARAGLPVAHFRPIIPCGPEWGKGPFNFPSNSRLNPLRGNLQESCTTRAYFGLESYEKLNMGGEGATCVKQVTHWRIDGMGVISLIPRQRGAALLLLEDAALALMVPDADGAVVGLVGAQENEILAGEGVDMQPAVA